ncbi:MAG: putative sporulation protein YtxC [Veillonellaceae bacterium]|nr:putative sporulation protein YtxC [Veillonellaceae bacterium]
MKLLSVGLTGTTDYIRARLQQDCSVLRQEGFRVAIDEINKGRYTFLGCNVIEGELSFRNYEKIKSLLKDYVAKLLADIIISREEKKLLKKIIDTNYYYFNENERSLIFVNALEILNTCSGTLVDFNLTARHSKIMTKIIQYLDNHHELVLEGFMNFRLKEYRKRLVEVVDIAVDDYMMDLEYKEFIRVLRYFIDIQEPKIEEVHVVIGQSGSYKILDTSGDAIKNNYLENFIVESASEINYEDLLITSLISIAPYNIMLHNHDINSSQNVVVTIKNVFEGRVALCEGCHICKEF